MFDTLQVYLGSLYVNDFNRFGRTYQVNAQAESEFRLQPEQIRRLKTRNDQRRDGAARFAGARCTRSYGPDQVMHYNGYPGRRDQRRVRARASARGRRRRRSPTCFDDRLPPGMSFEWTELAYQELLAGNTMLLDVSARACCSSTWSSPRSARAGRCRSASSSSCR